MIIKAIVDFLNDYNRDITIVFITIFITFICSKFTDISKKVPAFLIKFGQLKVVEIFKVLVLYVFPIVFIVFVIYNYRNAIMTFGLSALFTVFCAMYTIILNMLLIRNYIKVSLLQLQLQNQNLSTLNETFQTQLKEMQRVNDEVIKRANQ